MWFLVIHHPLLLDPLPPRALQEDFRRLYLRFERLRSRLERVAGPQQDQQVRPDHPCYLPWLRRSSWMRIGVFLGVEMLGRRVRNVREFAEALVVVMEEEA